MFLPRFRSSGQQIHPYRRSNPSPNLHLVETLTAIPFRATNEDLASGSLAIHLRKQGDFPSSVPAESGSRLCDSFRSKSGFFTKFEEQYEAICVSHFKDHR